MKNKTLKIISKALLVIILATSVLSLSSCGGPNIFGAYSLETWGMYYSHEEFQNFIEKYNSKNDGSVATFVSFDFPSNDAISYADYQWFNRFHLNEYYDKIYDKYQDGFGVRMTFYISDVDENGKTIKYAHQIYCSYSSTWYNANFDENNELTLTLFDDSTKKPRSLTEQSRIHILNSYSHYHYIKTYNLNVDGVDFMQISIASVNESMPQEKLDEILQLLMDNMVIINTGV